MVIKAAELVAFVLKAVKDKWGYVLGGNGEMYSRALAEKWAATRNKPKTWIGTKFAYFVEACSRWFGHYVADCSGLIIAALRSALGKSYQDQKADTLYSRCSAKGAIKTIPEIPGLCVWKKGHIGIYIGNGQVVESRGRTYGVVITKLSARPWTNWGKLADVDYSVISKEAEDMNLQNNDAAYGVQIALDALGFRMKMDPAKYGVNNGWGQNSKDALNAWKKSVGLAQDGKVDDKTACMLFSALVAKLADTADKTKDYAALKEEAKANASKLSAIKNIIG